MGKSSSNRLDGNRGSKGKGSGDLPSKNFGKPSGGGRTNAPKEKENSNGSVRD